MASDRENKSVPEAAPRNLKREGGGILRATVLRDNWRSRDIHNLDGVQEV